MFLIIYVVSDLGNIASIKVHSSITFNHTLGFFNTLGLVTIFFSFKLSYHSTNAHLIE